MNKSNIPANVDFCVGSAENILTMPKVSALPIFDTQVLDFLHALSKELLSTAKAYSDVTTFAFWCRKSSLQQQTQAYAQEAHRLGRGIAFHSTPSNVPINFAFSFVAGLLAGNANIIRLPAKDFPQVRIICEAIAKLLAQDEHKSLSPYVVMLRYASSTECHDFFSSLCQTRIIWGGDATIERIRLSPLPARSTELTFANRFSLAVIDADAYLQNENPQKIAQNFYNDTYFSDQNACTAPRFVIWLGQRKHQAKEQFWTYLQEEIHKRAYAFMPVQSVGKLAAAYTLSAYKDVHCHPTHDWTLQRIQLTQLEEDSMHYVHHSGFFLEYDAENLLEILPLCSLNCQTLSYYGLEQEVLQDFVEKQRPRGIDRMVPIGRTMEFSLVWDGFDLILSMSRKIDIC